MSIFHLTDLNESGINILHIKVLKMAGKAQKKDLSKILRPYENMWVALSKDNKKIIEADKTLEKLFKKLDGLDHRDFEFMKVPKFGVRFAPFS